MVSKRFIVRGLQTGTNLPKALCSFLELCRAFVHFLKGEGDHICPKLKYCENENAALGVSSALQVCTTRTHEPCIPISALD